MLIVQLFMAVGSGGLLFLAFPTYGIDWLAWLALVPLLCVLAVASRKKGFWFSFLCGIVFFTGVFAWVFEIPKFGFVHYLIISPYTGLYFGAFGLAFVLIRDRLGLNWAFLAAPFLWVAMEYIRSNVSFISLPWALLAHSQYENLAVIQFSEFTGAPGISFLIVLVNAGLAVAVLPAVWRLKRDRSSLCSYLSGRNRAVFAGATALCVALILFHGYATLWEPQSNKKIRVTVIQGNIDREMKARPLKHAEFIMGKYASLTRDASIQGADLILWPEAATPGLVLKNLVLRNQIISLVREINRHFLIGSSEYPKFIKNHEYKKGDVGNSALFFSPEGKVTEQYLKIHLVPFGEYVPLEGVISWPSFIVPEEKKSFEKPGNEFTLFDMKEEKFGAVICWEIVFPRLFSEFVKRGANFMTNLTNEGWFGDSAAPFQMLSMSVFRAVENKISLVRAANTGISCFIDPSGKITGRVQREGKDTFVDGHLTQPVLLSYKRTFYTLYGDVFSFGVLSASALLLFSAVLRRDRKNAI